MGVCGTTLSKKDNTLFGIDAVEYDLWKKTEVKTTGGALAITHLQETMNRLVSSMVEQDPLKVEVAGSTPVPNTKLEDYEVGQWTPMVTTLPIQPTNDYYYKILTDKMVNILPPQPIMVIQEPDIWREHTEPEPPKHRILELFMDYKEAVEAFKNQAKYPNTTKNVSTLTVENANTIFYFKCVKEPEALRGCSFDEIYCPKEKEGTDLHHAVLIPSTTYSKGKIVFR